MEVVDCVISFRVGGVSYGVVMGCVGCFFGLGI